MMKLKKLILFIFIISMLGFFSIATKSINYEDNNFYSIIDPDDDPEIELEDWMLKDTLIKPPIVSRTLYK